MANILIRGLDDEAVKRLKAEAAANGHSLQAEIREILTAASVRSMAANHTSARMAPCALPVSGKASSNLPRPVPAIVAPRY